jgi:hypothetical protein
MHAPQAQAVSSRHTCVLRGVIRDRREPADIEKLKAATRNNRAAE